MLFLSSWILFLAFLLLLLLSLMCHLLFGGQRMMSPIVFEWLLLVICGNLFDIEPVTFGNVSCLVLENRSWKTGEEESRPVEKERRKRPRRTCGTTVRDLRGHKKEDFCCAKNSKKQHSRNWAMFGPQAVQIYVGTFGPLKSLEFGSRRKKIKVQTDVKSNICLTENVDRSNRAAW